MIIVGCVLILSFFWFLKVINSAPEYEEMRDGTLRAIK